MMIEFNDTQGQGQSQRRKDLLAAMAIPSSETRQLTDDEFRSILADACRFHETEIARAIVAALTLGERCFVMSIEDAAGLANELREIGDFLDECRPESAR